MDLIWNITLICPWDCSFCCTDAVHVKKRGAVVSIWERGLSSKVIVNEGDSLSTFEAAKHYGLNPNHLDLALANRQQRGLEPSLQEKLNILQNIDERAVSIDFAGGDPLSCIENFHVIKTASEKFGKENISITATGHSVTRYGLNNIASIIGTYEFTFDEPIETPALNRPKGYNNSNYLLAEKLKSLGVKTKCQIPLHRGNASKDGINSIYKSLQRIGVDEILLMRTFPVGRGGNYFKENPQLTLEQYQTIIDQWEEAACNFGGPTIRLQCALKHIKSNSKTNPCDLVRDSLGINYQGLLLLSAWATNSIGQPLSDEFVVGSLIDNRLSELLRSERVCDLRGRLDENFGHCKIFSHIYSKKIGVDALLDKTDPLFINTRAGSPN